MEPKSIQSYVNKFRAEQFGNWESSIRNPPLSTVSDSDTRDFFLFRTEAILPTSKNKKTVTVTMSIQSGTNWILPINDCHDFYTSL